MSALAGYRNIFAAPEKMHLSLSQLQRESVVMKLYAEYSTETIGFIYECILLVFREREKWHCTED